MEFCIIATDTAFPMRSLVIGPFIGWDADAVKVWADTMLDGVGSYEINTVITPEAYEAG